MAWLLIVVAGAAEVVFAACLGASGGFTKVAPSLGVVVFGTLAVVVLSMALRDLPLSSGYAAFTAIGVLGTAVIGVIVHHERVTTGRAAAIALVAAGVVALRLAEGSAS
jgi:quaternary ammonium compound-resistance protein SugE